MKEHNDFLEEVKVYLDHMDDTQIKDGFIQIMQNIMADEYDGVFRILNSYSEETKAKLNEKHLFDLQCDARKDRVIQSLQTIQNKERYLIAQYNDTCEAVEDDECYDYSDPDHILDDIKAAIVFAKECIDTYRYDVASKLYHMLWTISVCANSKEERVTLDLYELSYRFIEVDPKEIGLLFLYSVYQNSSREDRPKKIYQLFQKYGYRNIRLEDLSMVGREKLKEVHFFWEDWIVFLMDTKEEDATQLLIDAVLFTKDMYHLAMVARSVANIHPRIFLVVLKNYQENQAYQQMFDLGREAISLVRKEYTIRSDIALLTSRAAYELKQYDVMHDLWFEAYCSRSNATNYLRLFLNDVVAQKYGVRAKEVHRNVGYQDYWYLNEPEMNKNIVSMDMDLTLRFLSGDFLAVKEGSVNPATSLGWSKHYIGKGVYLILASLCPQREVTSQSRYVARKLAESLEFYNGDAFAFADVVVQKASDIADILWPVFLKWKHYFSMPKADIEKYLSWLEGVIRERVDAIIVGEHKNHYKEVIHLLMALGEVKEVYGYENEKGKLISEFESKYGRYQNFQKILHTSIS